MDLGPIFIGGLALIIGVAVCLRCLRWLRRKGLMAKYGDPRVVDMIMRRMFWQGQTREQLLDSLGRPADIDERVMKTKTKETWKYHQTGRNRFGLRITVEDGVVIGWDQKD